jgi:hypothetical protein
LSRFEFLHPLHKSVVRVGVPPVELPEALHLMLQGRAPGVDPLVKKSLAEAVQLGVQRIAGFDKPQVGGSERLPRRAFLADFFLDVNGIAPM